MTDIIMRCKKLISQSEYKECERELSEEMAKNPHSAIPHNLMGILMEKENNHICAMKHFRAAYSLDPAYIPARYNMDQYAKMSYVVNCAYSEEDCSLQDKKERLAF